MCKEVINFYNRCNDPSHQGLTNEYTGSTKRQYMVGGFDCRCERIVSGRAQYRSLRCGPCLRRFEEQRQRERARRERRERREREREREREWNRK
jgi:hypothetical protein